jgi:hypothetical protein
MITKSQHTFVQLFNVFIEMVSTKQVKVSILLALDPVPTRPDPDQTKKVRNQLAPDPQH